MNERCPFCAIARGSVTADVVLTTDDIVAFRDLNPVAPVHVLVVPVEHVTSVSALEDTELGGRLLRTAARVARQEGLEGSGYRIVTNHGPDAGQSVHHLHLHVLGGRPMHWPPG